MIAQFHASNQKAYTVRWMQASDIDAILSIEQAAQQSPWSRSHFLSSLESSHQCYVVTPIDNDAAVVAYAITSTVVDEAELLNITVNPAYQRQGIAYQFLCYIGDSFDQKISTLFLEVRRSNLPAIALYEMFGFNEIGVRANYYPSSRCGDGAREDALLMAKALCL